MQLRQHGSLTPVRGALVVLLVLTASLVPLSGSASAATITQTFGYTGSTQTFTVPEGVSSLEVTLSGAKGGRGGRDSQGEPTPGGYRGVVTGSIDVTPGQVVTIGVGQGGSSGVTGGGVVGGAGGANPLEGYDGSVGGTSGPLGGSGSGGGGGAATVIRVAPVTPGGAAVDIVAAGAGGGGGSGQFFPIVGRQAESSHTPRPDSTTTVGRPGLTTSEVCSAGFRCDGGASGAGGGGVQGGDRGDVQYGGATATEYFGFGGFPGSNGTGNIETLSETYEYFADNNGHGSVVISYDSGVAGAPTRLTGTPRSGAVDLAWVAPTSSGAAEITDYVVYRATTLAGPYTEFADGVSTDTTATVTGLTNGTTYYFRVAAVNSYGTGANSAPMSVGVMPSDVPGAPTISTLTPGDSSLVLDITAGATHSPVIGHEYRLDGGSWISAQAESGRITVAGLVNGRTYAVQVRSLNAVGASAPSAERSGTPRAVPSIPSSVQATAGDSTVALSWEAPASTNGSPIQDYVISRATAESGPYTNVVDGTSTETSTVVGGLTNGTTYYFRVAATNAAGTGATSTPTGAVPFTLPGAPLVSSLTPVDGGLSVTLTQPSDGGSAITRYEYRLDGGAWTSTGSSARTFGIGALTNGTSYSLEVRALNAAGTGPASTALAGTPRTVPGAPAISTVALDTGAVGVSFSSGSDGGSAITNYQYSIDGGSTWTTRTPASTTSPVTIAGLTGGRTYSVALRAVNSEGAGAASNVSTVTAKGTPGAPGEVDATGSDRSVTVEFVAPPNGGTPITGYEYSLDDGATWTPRGTSSLASPLVISGLVNGQSYEVRLRATNAVGAGEASDAVDVTPRSTPSAPTIDEDTIVGEEGELDVVFSPPTDDGGATITTYEYSTDGGATWRRRAEGTTSSPLVITTLSSDGTTPLAGGEVYPVELRAVNAAGAGSASDVADGITTTAPEAPRISSIAPRDAAAAVAFEVPANGGSTILRFEYRLDGGSWTDTGSLSDRFVITGLVNSATHQVEVRAVNAVGASPASSARSVTISAAPAAPQVDGVVAGDGSLAVAFTAGDDGGAAITGYEYSTDGGVTWRPRTVGSTGSPLVITTASDTGDPLVNGELVSVQIRAVNAAGSGDASQSTLIAPLGAPEAPGDVVLTPGDGRLTLSFTPGSDGGSAITSIQYRVDGGEWVDAGALSSPVTIAGLVNGTTHQVELRAVSELAPGSPSAPVSGTPRTTPGAPTGVTAESGDASAVVSWTAPASDGGDAVDGYLVTVYDLPTGGIAIGSCTSTDTTSCQVTGLRNGQTVYVSVVALNAAGPGPVSAPRVALTPLAAPSVQIDSLAVSANSIQVDVDVQSDGGSAITRFEYRLDGGEWVSAATSTEPFTISGLVTGRSYSVEIRGVNVVGVGEASAAVSATPRTTPGAPIGVIAQSGDRSVALSWTVPTDTGGDDVTDYVVQVASSVSGPFTTFADGTSSSTTATVTGLTNGSEYFFRVSAANGAGAGPVSPVVASTPLAAPSAPTISSITPGNRFLQVVFTAGSSNGGSVLTGYEYSVDGGATWRRATGTSSPITISGLDNGRAYHVALRGVNAVGGGTSSNVVQSTPYGLPGAIQGFVASPSGSQVELSWDQANSNGSPITAYNLIRWSARTEGSILASYQTTSTSYTVTGLGNGTHYFTVEATNAAGTGQRSNPRTTAMVGSTVPAAPTVGAVTVSGDGVTGHTASVSWTAGAAGSQPVTGSIVRYLSPSDVSTTMATPETGSSTAEFALPSVAAGYRLQVANVSAVGVGPFTTIRPAIVNAEAPDDVTTRSATVHGSVDPNSTATSVQVEYAPHGQLGTGQSVLVAADPATVASDAGTVAVRAELVGLSPGTRYDARVVATAGTAVTRGATTEFTTGVEITTDGLDAVYDGEPVELSTTTAPEGLPFVRTFEGIDGTDHPIGSEPPTRAGTYRVITTVSDAGRSGSEDRVLTISRRPVTVEVSAADKIHDGTTVAELTWQLDGQVDGDDVSVDPSRISGEFAGSDAGDDQVVTVLVDGDLLTGDDAANYSVTVDETTTASILRRTQALSFVGTVPATLEVGSSWSPDVTSNADLDPVLSISDVSSEHCELLDGELVANSVGTCVLIATQPGTSNVSPAAPLARVISIVAPAPPTTTAPPTTVPPTTVPPTTVPPTTVPPTTAPPVTVPFPTAPLAPTTPMSPGAPTPWLGALGDTDGTGGAMGSDPSARGSNDPSRRGVVDGPASAVTGAGADGETDPAAPTPSATDGLDEGSDGERDGSDEDAAAATATPGLGDEVSGRLAGADDDSGNSGWWWVPTAALVAGGLWLGLRRRVLLDRED